jgi:hypothetical protein
LLRAPPDQETDTDRSHRNSIIYEVRYTSVIPQEEDGDENSSSNKAKQNDTNASSTNEEEDKEEDEEGDTASKTASPNDSGITTPPTPQTPSELPETEDETQSETSKSSRKPFRSDDPLSWYGILVPPSLRNAQKSFAEAIQGNIPELATVVNEMWQVEERVTSLRKEIGLS